MVSVRLGVVVDDFFQLATYIFSLLNINRSYFLFFQGLYGYGVSGGD